MTIKVREINIVECGNRYVKRVMIDENLNIDKFFLQNWIPLPEYVYS